MSIPGFTAEASLSRANAHYRQNPKELAGGAALRLAQIDIPFPPPFSLTGDSGSAAPVSPLAGGLEIYGNWCGPGNSGPGQPIDAVDGVCYLHDKCYDDNGYFDCACDRDLIARMPAAIANPSTSLKGKAVGAAAMAFFWASPCLCHKACVPFFGCYDLPGPIGVPGIPGLKTCPAGFA